MNQPVPFEQLIAFAAGKLPQAEADLIEAYLAKDAEAAACVARFRTVARSLRTDDSVAPPPATVEAAKALFRARETQRRPATLSWLEKLDRLVAALIFDSRPQLALAGFRGSAGEYQLAYETEGVQIDLEVSAAEADAAPRRVMGQISTGAEAKVECVVVSEPGSFEPVTLATPDVHGMFELNVQSGRFDLLVAVGGKLVVVPNFEVQ